MTAANRPRLRAVVVGLGQAGSRFDEDPGRIAPWSHVGAYLALADRFELVAACDVSPANVEAFQRRCPGVPVVADAAELAAFAPDMVSICTPAAAHAPVLHTVVDNPGLRMVWCEKPLAQDLGEAAGMVEACRHRGIPMMVSFNRSWLPLWRHGLALIEGGAVGTVRSVRVAMPNRLHSIGSHAVALALLLGGPVEAIASLSLPAMTETGEPAVAALLRYRSGAGGMIQVTGLRNQLMVEAEIIGDEGRLYLSEDRGTILRQRFAPSTAFAGYRQLADADDTEHLPLAADFSAFVAMAENAHSALTEGIPLACDGERGLEVQRLLAEMAVGA